MSQVGTTVVAAHRDEPLCRARMRALSQAGFTVFETSTANEVRSLVSAHPPDAVLLDFSLPGLNGIDLCRELRSNWPGTLVILTIASPEPALEQQALEAGAVCIPELLDSSRIVAEVRRVIARATRLREQVADGLDTAVHLMRMAQANVADLRDVMTKHPAGAGKVVLVAEPSDVVRNVVSRTLGLRGYVVLEADSHASAIALLRRYQGAIDLALVDWSVVDRPAGLLQPSDIREFSPCAGIVVMATGACSDVGESFTRTEIDGILEKPFRSTQLAATVAEALQARTHRAN